MEEKKRFILISDAPRDEEKEEDEVSAGIDEESLSDEDLIEALSEDTPKEEPKEESKEETPAEEPVEVPVTEEPVEEPAIEEPVEEVTETKYPEKYTDIYPRPAPRMKKPEGPNFLFYAEREDRAAGDQIVYSGDDALPYLNDNIIITADGLGGGGAIKHREFSRKLFEEDLVFNTLFENMYGPKEENPLLNDYTIDSFAVLISMRNLYDDPLLVNRYSRVSGHFGSRIASIVMLHELLKEETKNKVYGLFDIYNSDEEEEFKNGALKELNEELTENFRKEFLQAAKNGNFFYESKMLKLDLLGTTMCATYLRENEEDVQAFYLLAGDSLPFFLNKDGLAEVMHAHEDAHQIMTNKIRANDTEEKKFFLESRYLKVKKPCILFNASDGVFDCRHFISPLAMEKFMLDTIMESSSYEEVGNKLHDFFVVNGKHDDSSSMAAKFFGFNSFEEVKAMAKARLDVIRDEYLDEAKGGMPTLLDYDYGALIGNVKHRQKNGLDRLFYLVEKNPEVAKYYEKLNRHSGGEDKLKEDSELIMNSLHLIEDNLKLHQGLSFKLDENKEVQEDVIVALTNELERFKEILKEYEDHKSSVIYKSFKDELNDRGADALNTLIKAGLYTEEQVAEMMSRFFILPHDEYKKTLEESVPLLERQQELFKKYEESYNRLIGGHEDER